MVARGTVLRGSHHQRRAVFQRPLVAVAPDPSDAPLPTCVKEEEAPSPLALAPATTTVTDGASSPPLSDHSDAGS